MTPRFISNYSSDTTLIPLIDVSLSSSEDEDETYSSVRKMRNPRLVLTSALAVLIFVVFVGVLYYRTQSNDGKAELVDDPIDEIPPSSTVMGVFKEAAIVTNADVCGPIGGNILRRGGKAVDAIIAAALCDGVVFPQNTGLGGGFLMTYYDKKEKKVYSVNSRETAPAAATETMFHGDKATAQRGGLSIAVPGELKGFWTIYNRFGGGIAWSELFNETISLCRKGIPITRYLHNSLRRNSVYLDDFPAIKKLYTNQDTGKLFQEGEFMKRPKLADTMEVFQREGGDALYTGSLAKGFFADLQTAGSIITEADLANYRTEIEDTPVKADLKNDLTLYSVNLPGSGPVIAHILTLLNGMIPTPDLSSDFVKIVEALKFSYARRSEFGDPKFVNNDKVLNSMNDPVNIERIRKEIKTMETSQDPTFYGANFTAVADAGTANLAVLAANGDAAVLTSTINLHHGSFVLSESTGIILNDCMDDFSAPNMTNYFNLPPSTANFIRPGKRPVSSMCPSIILDKNGEVRLLVGAAGGSKITSASALIAMLNLWYDKTVKEAVDYRRVHHQVFPMHVFYEFGLKKSIVEAMKKAGHKLVRLTDENHFGTAANAIAKNGEVITVAHDPRRLGGFDGY